MAIGRRTVGAVVGASGGTLGQGDGVAVGAIGSTLGQGEGARAAIRPGYCDDL